MGNEIEFKYGQSDRNSWWVSLLNIDRRFLVFSVAVPLPLAIIFWINAHIRNRYDTLLDAIFIACGGLFLCFALIGAWVSFRNTFKWIRFDALGVSLIWKHALLRKSELIPYSYFKKIVIDKGTIYFHAQCENPKRNWFFALNKKTSDEIATIRAQMKNRCPLIKEYLM